jgi:hypothetical protein
MIFYRALFVFVFARFGAGLKKLPPDSAVRFPGRLESGSGRGSMIFHRALFVFVFARPGAGLKTIFDRFGCKTPGPA